MLHKTRGIVFQVTDFKETSVIAKIYTELFGLQGYLINSVRKKNAKVKQNVLHPLSLVDLVVYHKEKKTLRRVAEIHPNPVLRNIPFDISRSSIALFLDEVLCKAIREEESNPLLFEFLFHSIQILDVQEKVSSDFHLRFLLRLSRYLGFYPNNPPQEDTLSFAQEDNGRVSSTSESASGGLGRSFFNLREGVFQSSAPIHPYYIESPLTDSFKKLLQSSVDFSSASSITITEKRILTEKILEYYQLHLAGFSGIKSHKVLEEVWKG